METVKAKHEAILKSIYCLHSKSLFWLPISCIGQPSCPRLCAWLFCVPSQDTTKETIAIQDQESHLHHEGKKYLKFRPTSQTIIAILLGHSPKKNASLSNHELLTQLKKAGNTEMNKFQTETPQDDDGLPEPAK